MSDDRLGKYREFDGPVPGGDEPSGPRCYDYTGQSGTRRAPRDQRN